MHGEGQGAHVVLFSLVHDVLQGAYQSIGSSVYAATCSRGLALESLVIVWRGVHGSLWSIGVHTLLL